MCRSGIAAAAASLLFVSAAAAQRYDAVDDFLKPIVSRMASDPNLGGWAWETNGNGGYLLRTLMDVTGDGRPEAFVATTLESSRYAHHWRVFDVADDGSMRPYEKTLDYKLAWPITESGKLHLLYLPGPNDEKLRTSDPMPYPIYRYSFSFPKIEETVSWVSEKDAALFEPKDDGSLPKMQVILLADYLGNSGEKWSEEKRLKRNGLDHYYTTEDEERAEKNTSFTAQVALAKLNLDPQDGTRRSKPDTSPTDMPRSGTEASDKASSSEVSEGRSTSRAIWLAVIASMAAVGALLLVLRRKSK